MKVCEICLLPIAGVATNAVVMQGRRRNKPVHRGTIVTRGIKEHCMRDLFQGMEPVANQRCWRLGYERVLAALVEAEKHLVGRALCSNKCRTLRMVRHALGPLKPA